MHRLITNCPKDMQVDHINHNTLDNRKNNLRTVTIKQNQENLLNARINSKSKIRSVSWSKDHKKWRVTIGHNQKQIFGGYFNNLEHAELKAIELRQKYFTHSKECDII